MSASGAELFAIVEQYAALDHHRTGSENDARTLDWIERQLRDRGAAVERWPWTFDRYDASWRVTLDGDEIPAIPVWYQGVGSFAAARPHVSELDAGGGMPVVREAVARIAAEADNAGAPLALAAVQGWGGRLWQVNHAPEQPRGLPVLFVPGACAERLLAGEARVDFSAAIVPGASANVLARFGAGDRPLVIGTPLSGWFSCAGERGTGIALALELAREAAALCPVLFLTTSGHELEDLGLQLWLRQARISPRAIVHIGASVAAGEADGVTPPRTLAVRRQAVTSLQGAAFDQVAEAVRPIGLAPRAVPTDEARDPTRWIGEARQWCARGAPLLSFAGGFPLFHTPEDRAAVATTPALLAEVYAAFRACLPALAAQ